MQILNRLLEHRNFPKLIDLIRIYFQEAADQVRQSSRRYAKRQLTWFRRNGHIHWLTRNPGQGDGEILNQARRIFQENDN